MQPSGRSPWDGTSSLKRTVRYGIHGPSYGPCMCSQSTGAFWPPRACPKHEARAPSTRRRYALKWSVFSTWCQDRNLDHHYRNLGSLRYGTSTAFLAVLWAALLSRFFEEIWDAVGEALVSFLVLQEPMDVQFHCVIIKRLQSKRKK